MTNFLPVPLPGTQNPLPPVIASVIGPRKYRVALIGDSICQRASTVQNLPTTVGSYVVSGNGVGTLTFGANVAIMTGNYFVLNNVSDIPVTHPDNGRAFLCVSGSNAVTWTPTITFNSFAPAGDYSNFQGGFWAANSQMSTLDSGLFTVLNAYARQQFLVTLTYGAVGEISTNTLAKIPKILAGPPFEVAFMAVDGINDTQVGTPLLTCANNYITAIQLLQAAGKQVIIQTGNPIRIATGPGFLANNQYMVALRKIMLEFCKRNNQIIVYDALKEMLIGSASTNADVYSASNSVGAFVYSADVHPSQNAYYTMARNQNYLTQQIAAAGYPQIENSLISVLDDSVNFTQPTGFQYANLQQNGGMVGTVGTLAGGATGSVATGWTLTATGAPTSCVGTGGFTPTQIGAQNNANYAFAQRIQLTASATGQGFTFKGPFGPTVTPGWYQIGFNAFIEGAVGGGAPTSGLGAISGSYNLGPGNVFIQSFGADSIGYQLLNGDKLWYASGPVFLDRAPSVGQLFIIGTSLAAGSFAIQAQGAFLRPIDNPYV